MVRFTFTYILDNLWLTNKTTLALKHIYMTLKIYAKFFSEHSTPLATFITFWKCAFFLLGLSAPSEVSLIPDTNGSSIGSTFIPNYFLPGHDWGLQSIDSFASPSQGAPPFKGGVHVRDLVFVPVPQLFVQAVHWPHSDHLPSIAKNEKSTGH